MSEKKKITAEENETLVKENEQTEKKENNTASKKAEVQMQTKKKNIPNIPNIIAPTNHITILSKSSPHKMRLSVNNLIVDELIEICSGSFCI